MCAAVPAAADIELTARVSPDAVAVGTEAELVVSVSGKFRAGDPPLLPQLDEFEIYQSGTQQQFSIINGRPTSSLTYNYVLIPSKAGTYDIPIRFKADDKVYTTSVKLEVVDTPVQIPPPPGASDQEVAEQSAGSPLFVTATVDRDTVYVNEQITWTLGFYTDGRTDLLRSPEYQPPNVEGFWVEDLPSQRNEYRQVNGRRYLVSEVKRAFFPTAPGEYEIAGARVDVVVNDVDGRNSFDDFFRRRGAFGFGKPKSLHAKSIEIVVLPLPAQGRPRNFTGIVGGSLDVALKADKQVVNAGDPINVSLEIKGEGNFKTIAAPQIPDMEGFKMYESGSKSDLFKNNDVISGRKRTDFVLIPKEEGHRTIAPISLSYFDPDQNRYVTTSSNGIELNVQPAAQAEGQPVIFTGTGENIEVIGHDINFIRPAPAEVSSSRTRIYRSTGYLALHALPLLALAVSVVVERRRRRWQADTSLFRASRAARHAEKTLSQARDAHKKGDAQAAYASVSTALRDYMADKMDTSSAGSTMADLEAFMERRGVDEETIARLLAILKDCDLVQYAGAAAPADADRAIGDAQAMIKTLEKRYLK